VAAPRAAALRVRERRPRHDADALAVLLDDGARGPRIRGVGTERDEAAPGCRVERGLEAGLSQIARVVVGDGHGADAGLRELLEPAGRRGIRETERLRVDLTGSGLVVGDDGVCLAEERTERRERSMDRGRSDEARTMREDVTADDHAKRAFERRRPRRSERDIARRDGRRARDGSRRGGSGCVVDGLRRARRGREQRQRNEREHAPTSHVVRYPTRRPKRTNLRRLRP
jgi:hypothetical protein